MRIHSEHDELLAGERRFAERGRRIERLNADGSHVVARTTQGGLVDVIVVLEAPRIEVATANDHAGVGEGDVGLGGGVPVELVIERSGHGGQRPGDHVVRNPKRRSPGGGEADEPRDLAERRRAPNARRRNVEGHVDRRGSASGHRHRSGTQAQRSMHAAGCGRRHAVRGRGRTVVGQRHSLRGREVRAELSEPEVERRRSGIPHRDDLRHGRASGLDEARATPARSIADDLGRIARVDDRGLDLLDAPSRMRLSSEGRHAGDHRRRHGRSRDAGSRVAAADQRRLDAHTGSGDVGLQPAVSVARTTRAEACECLEARVGDGRFGEGRAGGRHELVPVIGRCGTEHATDAEERNGDGERLTRIRIRRDRPLERRESGVGVDHRHRRRTGLLAEDRARDTCARSPQADRQLVAAGSDACLLVSGDAAAECLVLTGRRRIVLEHHDGQRLRRDRRSVRIEGTDRSGSAKIQAHAREAGRAVDRCDADCAGRRSGRAGDVLGRPLVARGRHHDDAGIGRVARGLRRRIV